MRLACASTSRSSAPRPSHRRARSEPPHPGRDGMRRSFECLVSELRKDVAQACRGGWNWWSLRVPSFSSTSPSDSGRLQNYLRRCCRLGFPSDANGKSLPTRIRRQQPSSLSDWTCEGLDVFTSRSHQRRRRKYFARNLRIEFSRNSGLEDAHPAIEVCKSSAAGGRNPPRMIHVFFLRRSSKPASSNV